MMMERVKNLMKMNERKSKMIKLIIRDDCPAFPFYYRDGLRDFGYDPVDNERRIYLIYPWDIDMILKSLQANDVNFSVSGVINEK